MTDADDLWDWLLACIDCGQQHELREHPDPCPCCGGQWRIATWASPVDGHARRQRWHNGGGPDELRKLYTEELHRGRSRP